MVWSFGTHIDLCISPLNYPNVGNLPYHFVSKDHYICPFLFLHKMESFPCWNGIRAMRHVDLCCGLYAVSYHLVRYILARNLTWKEVAPRQMGPDGLLGCLDNFKSLLWSLVVAEITLQMISSWVGYTVTFSLPHSIISHLPSCSLLVLFAGQVHLIKNTSLYQNVCKSWGKIFQFTKKGIREPFHKQQL